MGSMFLTHLHSAWHVDQAILSEESRLVVLRFGSDANPECMRMDEHLYKIADRVKNFAVIYTVDNREVTDFNGMYEIYDPCTVSTFLSDSTSRREFGREEGHFVEGVALKGAVHIYIYICVCV